MPRYKNVAGVAHEVDKRYRNIDGVARKVDKGYVRVDGVARQYFSADVTWAKYSIGFVEAPNHEHLGQTHNLGLRRGDNGFYSYDIDIVFSPDYGYIGTNAYVQSAEDLVGKSYAGQEYVVTITSATENDDGTEVYMTGICTHHARYTAGAKFFGELSAPEGQLPEDGTLWEGSALEDYFVMTVGGKMYYYVKL